MDIVLDILNALLDYRYTGYSLLVALHRMDVLYCLESYKHIIFYWMIYVFLPTKIFIGMLLITFSSFFILHFRE